MFCNEEKRRLCFESAVTLIVVLMPQWLLKRIFSRDPKSLLLSMAIVEYFLDWTPFGCF